MIKLQNISKEYYEGKTSFLALKDISISINEGEFVVVTGASGSGKTTLLNIIGCIDSASSGTYYLNDEDLTNANEQKKAELRNVEFGFVLQDFQLLKEESAIFNVALPLLLRKISRTQIKQCAERALQSVGLSGYDTKKTVLLSGGQQQRVAIARAIVGDAKIIIADEPTGSLDSQSGNEILQLLSTLNQKGKTIIIATHNMDILKYATRNIELLDGQIIKDIAINQLEQ